MDRETIMPTPPLAPPSVSTADFRRALGSFPSGVTVVTGLRDGQVHGITVSAFLSVSLEPPLVLVSIGNRAPMHTTIRTTGRYAVSVLAADQAALSDHFAGRRLPDGDPPFHVDGDTIPTVEGAIATVQCVLHDAVEAGDHTLFVGRVVGVSTEEGEALAYWRGKYRRVE